MYISCPKCDKSFVVSYEQLGEKGRKVKCSNCQHLWHQKPDFSEDFLKNVKSVATEEKAVIAEPIGNGVNLPALLPIKIPAYLYTAPFVLLCMVMMILVMLFPNFFGMKSLLNDDFLSIKDVNITVAQNDTDISQEGSENQGKKMLISYKIANSAENPASMPLVRIRLLDKGKRIIKSHIVDHTDIKLLGKQYVLIKTELPVPNAADSVDFMLGNRVDFILRN